MAPGKANHHKLHAAGSECHACIPPYVFRHKPTEELFQDYSLSIRRTAVSSVLGVFILLTAVLAILYFAYQKMPTEKNLYHISLCVLGIGLYIFINTKYLKTRGQLKIVSYMLWVLLLLFAFISLPLGTWSTSSVSNPLHPADGVWQCLFIIHSMYLILPVNFFMLLIFGISLSLIHTAVVLIRLQNLHSIQQVWTQIMVNVTLFVAVNAVGIQAHHMNEKTQRKSFINCRNYVGANLEAEEQRLKLVKVAETCLPKFICREVCADLTMYHSVVCPRQIFPKIYQNVSIAFINLCGLDRLKSSVDPSDFMELLNDLTLTFEMLCETHNCLSLTALGDHYVAVSGIPLPDTQVLQNCISLCLDMIQATQLIQYSKGVALEAYTGVHVGSVVTAVVGIYRWQYRASSSDYLLTRHLALTGTPGKVHITEPCIHHLQSHQYDVQLSNAPHGSGYSTYYLQPHSNIRNFHMSPAVLKLSRKLSKANPSASSFAKLDDESPFYTQFSRSEEGKPSMTTCLLEGKVFVHRLNNHYMDGDATTGRFQNSIIIGRFDQEVSSKMSFFSLAFYDKLTESTFRKESKGFGITMSFLLILLAVLSTLHFALLPRTMLMLAATLLLFLLTALLLICVLANKLNMIKSRCLNYQRNKFIILLIIIFIVITNCLVNELTCPSSVLYKSLPIMFKYAILGEESAQTQCSNPYYIFLSGIIVFFMVSVMRISHIIQIVLIVIACIGYLAVVTFTNRASFDQFDAAYSVELPPSAVMAIVALILFALHQILSCRQLEHALRLDHLWRHNELMEYQHAQDMMTLRQGIAENALPTHVLSYYNSPECIMKPYVNCHKLVGVAIVTVPNFPAYMGDVCTGNLTSAFMQVMHDITSAFDHLLRRGDFHVVEKVYDQGLSFVLASGLNNSFLASNKSTLDQDFLVHHMCKLIDLILDMKHCLMQLNAMSGRNLVLRAGISMGPAFDGVLGSKRPSYTIWGPTVEFAKKLELTGKSNSVQVNKDVAQLLKRRFQFQPRTQSNMAALQDIQPYVVVGRRLQSVVASDNVSLASEFDYGCRSPYPQHDRSVGSISQAETVLVSSQHPLLGSSNSYIRTSSFDLQNSTAAKNPQSACSTPSSSFNRNASRDGIAPGWKIPQVPSQTKMGVNIFSRPLSPELPAVHYSKTNTPPAARPDGRGTIILTQASLTGNPATYSIVPDAASQSLPDMISPVAIAQPSLIAKTAHVVNTDSRKNSSSQKSSISSQPDENSQPRSQRGIMPSQPKNTPQFIVGGKVAPYPQKATSGPQAKEVVSASTISSTAPLSPPPQNLKMSPAMCYTKTSSSSHMHTRTPSRASSSSAKDSVVEVTMDRPINRKLENNRENDMMDTELLDGMPQSVPVKKSFVLDLDHIMMASIYSDKMQTSMEGNVSSTSTTPDVEESTPFQPVAVTNDFSNADYNASLSPLLKHQLNRFANRRDSSHKSPHLSRKKKVQNTSGRIAAHSISSISPPSTPECQTPVTIESNIRPSDDQTLRSDAASSKSSKSTGARSQASVIASHSEQVQGSSYQRQSIEKSSPPPLPIPPPPLESVTESEFSELSDDDNVNVDKRYDASATDYDNMYSTDTGTYNSKIIIPLKYKQKGMKRSAHNSKKFVAKLQQMQKTDCNVRDLYSEIESDVADCESLVGDTDYEMEPLTTSVAPPYLQDYNNPLQKLQWTENKLLALLRPARDKPNGGTLGSTLRHCRSMELLPQDDPNDLTRVKKAYQRRHCGTRHSQNLDDALSVTSSIQGSEFSRSDPYLSDAGACESEYDNHRSNGSRYLNDVLTNTDLNPFDQTNFDKMLISENITTHDYILSLQQHIERGQKLMGNTDV